MRKYQGQVKTKFVNNASISFKSKFSQHRFKNRSCDVFVIPRSLDLSSVIVWGSWSHWMIRQNIEFQISYFIIENRQFKILKNRVICSKSTEIVMVSIDSPTMPVRALRRN